MANISFTISSAPGITNDLIAVIYKTTAPAAEVDRIVKDAPHPDPYNFEFTDIASGTYIVKIHESPDGSTLGILRHDFWVDATIQKVLAYDIIDFIVDLGRGAPHYDPVDSATQYENPNLNGKTYVVFKPGFGALVWGTHIQTITGGGFEFINGQMFANGEEYTVLVSNLTYNNIQESAAGYPADVVLLTGNTSFGNSHYNKLLEVNGVGSVVTITIASIDTIPDGTKFGINTHNGTQRYVTLQLPVSKFCLINFVQYNAIYIGRGEEVTFIKKGAYLRIVHWDGDYRRVGERVMGEGVAPWNSLPMLGGWYLKSDYPRLYYWYVSKLPLSEIGAATDDSTPNSIDQTKWNVGIAKFWVPNHGGWFYRALDPDGDIDDQNPNRLSNQQQQDDNKDHNHVAYPWNRGSARASEVDNTNTPGSIDSNNPTTEYRVGGMSVDNWEAARIKSQGTQSRPKNLAVMPYVII